jgi:hypothetical protein
MDAKKGKRTELHTCSSAQTVDSISLLLLPRGHPQIRQSQKPSCEEYYNTDRRVKSIDLCIFGETNNFSGDSFTDIRRTVH